ncbi:MAG: hypothetical protein ACI3ZT_00830 [Candidatus Cryptobacteroides sp.]
MKIEITQRQAEVLALAVTNYIQALEDHSKMSGSLLGADFHDKTKAYKEEAHTVLDAILKANTKERAGDYPIFRKEQKNLATEAFWYIKKQVDEQGRIRAETKHAGATIEWDDCDRFPYVGIGTRGEVLMYSDNWNAYTAQDSDILKIAIKLQEEQGNV